MRRTTLLVLVGFLALIPVAGSRAAIAQSGNFIISQHGKQVGTASFNFTRADDGFDSSSIVRITMQGLDYALSKTEQLNPGNQLKHVHLSAAINHSAVTVTGAPDAVQLLLNISANGRSSTTRLDPHPAAVFLADFDPGAFETLLALAVTGNNRDLWAIIPRGAGSIEPIKLATYADEQGTLDGSPILVHHLIANIGGAVTDIFSGPENQLLQAELAQPGFSMVRKGFVLTPPANPGAPPQETPPQQ